MANEQPTQILDNPDNTQKENRYLYTFSEEGTCIGISAKIYCINKSDKCIQCGKCYKCYDSIRTNPPLLKYDK
jgi:polyferredoxin